MKTKLRTKIIAWVITLAMLAAVVPFTAIPVFAEGSLTDQSNIAIGNSGNASDTLVGDGLAGINSNIANGGLTIGGSVSEGVSAGSGSSSSSSYEEESSVIVVGGVALADGDYLANGATAVSDKAPAEGGYAHYANGVLTLNSYEYNGKGYMYSDSEYEYTDSETGEPYTEYFYYYAGIYADVEIEIVLKGESSIVIESIENTALEYYYSDGINIDEYATATIGGDGKIYIEAKYDAIDVGDSLTVKGGSYEFNVGDDGFEISDNITIENGTFDITSGDDGIDANYVFIENGTFDITSGDDGIDANYAFIENGTFTIKSESDGIYVFGDDLTISGGKFNITAEDDGIEFYCYGDGCLVEIKDAKLTVNAKDNGFDICYADLKLSGSEINLTTGNSGIYVDYGNATVSDSKLTVDAVRKVETVDSDYYYIEGIYVKYDLTIVGESDVTVNVAVEVTDTAENTDIGVDMCGIFVGTLYVYESTLTVDSEVCGIYYSTYLYIFDSVVDVETEKESAICGEDMYVYGMKTVVRATTTAFEEDNRKYPIKPVYIFIDYYLKEVFPEDDVTWEIKAREDSYPTVYIGIGGNKDVEIGDGEYIDENGNISDEKPEGSYAYYEYDAENHKGVLTLHNFECDYIEAGYNLDIVLEGNNKIKGRRYYGGIDSCYGHINITGTEGASLDITAECGIYAEYYGYGDVTITDSEITIDAENNAIYVGYGDVNIADSTVTIISGYDGIVACGIVITNSEITIDSDWDGISSVGDIAITGSEITVDSENVGIFVENDIYIADSTVDITSGYDGIYTSYGDTTITKSKINVIAEGYGVDVGNAVTIADSDIGIEANDYGIDAYDDIIITNSVLDIETIEAAGIYTYGNIIIKEDSEVTVETGSYGIYAEYGEIDITGSALELDTLADGIHAYEGDAIITDSTLIITSDSDGIESYEEDVIITNCTLTITAGDDGIASDSKDVDIIGCTIVIYCEDDGIYTDSDKINIKDSTITIYAEDDGIEAEDDDLTITNSKITIYSDDEGIYADYDTVITDSVIYIEAGGDGIVACYDIDYDSVFTITGGDIEIKADLNAVKIYSGELSYDGFIAIPEAAELKELYDEEYECNYLSLADANGEIATHVIILTEKRTSKIDIEEKNSYIYNGEERLGYKGDIETDCAGALEMLYVGINGTEYHSENAPTDAGNYRLTISVPESDPVYKGSTEIDFTIEKKTLDVIWQKTGFTYDGEEKSPIVSIRGILLGDECEVKVTGAASEAGEHTATVEITNDNYRILDEDRECEFTIVDTDAVVDDTVDQITNYIFENVVKKIVRAIFGKIFAAFANI